MHRRLRLVIVVAGACACSLCRADCGVPCVPSPHSGVSHETRVTRLPGGGSSVHDCVWLWPVCALRAAQCLWPARCAARPVLSSTIWLRLTYSCLRVGTGLAARSAQARIVQRRLTSGMAVKARRAPSPMTSDEWRQGRTRLHIDGKSRPRRRTEMPGE